MWTWRAQFSSIQRREHPFRGERTSTRCFSTLVESKDKNTKNKTTASTQVVNSTTHLNESKVGCQAALYINKLYEKVVKK